MVLDSIRTQVSERAGGVFRGMPNEPRPTYLSDPDSAAWERQYRATREKVLRDADLFDPDDVSFDDEGYTGGFTDGPFGPFLRGNEAHQDPDQDDEPEESGDEDDPELPPMVIELVAEAEVNDGEAQSGNPEQNEASDQEGAGASRSYGDVTKDTESPNSARSAAKRTRQERAECEQASVDDEVEETEYHTRKGKIVLR